MTEFALILPLLLLVMIGLMELGRLFVIYVSVHAASREAARYASAAGDADPNQLGLQPYYMDTVGITAAARRLTVLTGVNTVEVTWDHGPKASESDPDKTFTPVSVNQVSKGDRVVITVKANYVPMLGLTPLEAFEITSMTARTIVKSLEVAGPSNGNGGSGAPLLEIILPVENPGTPYYEGSPITFQGLAKSSDGVTILSDLIQWSSSTDPSLFTGATNTLNLPAGSPPSYVVIITAQVTDPATGEMASQSRVIQVYQILPPNVTLTTPAGGAKYQVGQEVTFTGSATSAVPPYADLTASMVWKARFNGSPITLGAGSPLKSSSLAEGIYEVWAEAVENGVTGKSAVVTFTVMANEPPILTILTPVDQSTYSDASQVIYFTATAVDSLDGDLGSEIYWFLGATSLGTGAGLSVPKTAFIKGKLDGTLTVVVTAVVSDHATPANLVYKDVTFYIVTTNNPPLIAIDSPSNNAALQQGRLTTFIGTASDKGQNSDISYAIQWYSTIDGYLGQGRTISVYLSSGNHKITARVTDTSNPPLTSTASINITVAPNQPPVVNLLSPPDRAIYDSSDSITFAATATDAEDGSLSADLKWYDNNVLIATGTGFITHTLSVGTHAIRAQVTDSGGFTDSDEVVITIQQSAVCPTGNELTFICQQNTCDKLAWQFTTAGSTEYDVQSIVVNWENTSFSPRLAWVSWGGGSPDPIAYGSNSYIPPVSLTGNPLWSGAFNPYQGGGGLYSRTLIIAFSSPTPTKGLTGVFNVDVTFANCPTSQASTTIPVP